MDKLKICRIQVKKLFGNISYDIELTEDNPIAIVTAPNGRGKTTMLNLLSFVLNPSNDTFRAIRKIPFEEFECTLTNQKTVVLKQIQKASESDAWKAAQFRRGEEDAATLRSVSLFDKTDFEFCINGEKDHEQQSMVYSEVWKQSAEVDPEEYLDENDEDYAYNVYYRRPMTGFVRLKFLWKVQNEILERSGCVIPVNFIKADRIQPVMVRPSRLRDYDEPRQEDPLKRASKKIADLIKTETEKYNDAVSKAKDKLPQMFLDEEGSDLPSDVFMEGWSSYRKELDQYQEIGLIKPTGDFTRGKDILSVYHEADKGKFLSTYLSAFKDTTRYLRNIYDRLNLFKQTLDERNVITGKKVMFDREGVSLSSGDRKIELDTLSSGEKHDFIMFYNLIFNISANGLVLIDEPEISLHIEWQETYLDKLIAICEMNDLQAIVATHSPNIVSSHYDLLVDKGETDG